ncbi:LtrC-like protein, partial [Neglecta sp. X4]|nr:LtrC-like protein [Neglectibacter sp. X4]
MTSNFKPKRAEQSQRPQLSTEEWMAKKQAEKEEVYAVIDETAKEVLSDPAKLQGFLDTQSRMDRYSAANALLIFKQYPSATQLKSFGDWGEENVKINKGEKSLSILEPVEYTK